MEAKNEKKILQSQAPLLFQHKKDLKRLPFQ